MDPPPASQPVGNSNGVGVGVDVDNAPPSQTKTRSESFSQNSETSQTAAEFIRDQEQLEADAREALPYSIENCTKLLGPLRQSVFACLTCNPAPANPSASYDGAGVCYSCSVQCHGEHQLVEIFNKRNFTCDCGTTRLPAASPCNLRVNPATNTKGGVHSEASGPNNKYNQNFRNRFCGCACDYDPFQQKGTMYQCLGLGTHEEGGCGEDWWHPGCLVGLGPRWFEKMPKSETAAKSEAEKEDKKNGNETTTATATAAATATGTVTLAPISEDAEMTAEEQNNVGNVEDTGDEDENEDDPPPPPGFPGDDEFDGFICYKCVESFPWIKRYAGAAGFLAPVFLDLDKDAAAATAAATAAADGETVSKKRKASDDDEGNAEATQDPKRQKSDGEEAAPTATAAAAISESKTEAEVVATPKLQDLPPCRLSTLPPAPTGRFSIFYKEDFRQHICRCASCFPLLTPHPQLLEEEETYEPPVSEDGRNGGSENNGSTLGSGSLLGRGESALRNVDRVRAIEGVMAYNQLKDKLKPFFQQFAESGQAISAEDIKEYFAKLRGDDEAIRAAGEAAKSDDFREEQSGY